MAFRGCVTKVLKLLGRSFERLSLIPEDFQTILIVTSFSVLLSVCLFQTGEMAKTDSCLPSLSTASSFTSSRCLEGEHLEI